MNLKDEEVLKLSDSETSKEERTKLLAKKFRMENRDNNKMTFLISIPFILIVLFWLLEGSF